MNDCINFTILLQNDCNEVCTMELQSELWEKMKELINIRRELIINE